MNGVPPALLIVSGVPPTLHGVQCVSAGEQCAARVGCCLMSGVPPALLIVSGVPPTLHGERAGAGAHGGRVGGLAAADGALEVAHFGAVGHGALGEGGAAAGAEGG
jgi:hypothetical protein